MNRMLDGDVAVKRIAVVDNDFHARFSAVARSYRYEVGWTPDPFRHRYSWLLPQLPDIEAMNRAAQHLLGRHDFTTFSKINDYSVQNPVCDVRQAEWNREGDRATFAISADRFLYGMVRHITGVLVRTGSNETKLDPVDSLLARRTRSVGYLSAPPHGLTLVGVEYPSDPFAA
jgi:tRNA pseudouridine38-40 synthase